MAEVSKEQSVKHMQNFLRNELAAVETYQNATNSLKRVESELTDARLSHQKSVDALREHLRGMGEEPASDSGAWGSFANMAQSLANAGGESAAVSLLEEGEDGGLADYRKHRDELLPQCRQLVDGTLLPEQEKSHRMLSDLKKRL